MQTITFQLDASGVSVNGAVYVVGLSATSSSNRMNISTGSIYSTSVTLAAGRHKYKFCNGASGDWEGLVGQSCAVETETGRGHDWRQLVVTTGEDRTVGPFCFGSCNPCPPPTAPRDAGGGGSGRRRTEQSYFPLWMVFAIAAIAFATIALGGTYRRRAHRRRKRLEESGHARRNRHPQPTQSVDEAASEDEDDGCKQLELLAEKSRAMSLVQITTVALPAPERQPPRGRAQQSAPAGPVGQIRHIRSEIELAESEVRWLERLMLP